MNCINFQSPMRDVYIPQHQYLHHIQELGDWRGLFTTALMNDPASPCINPLVTSFMISQPHVVLLTSYWGPFWKHSGDFKQHDIARREILFGAGGDHDGIHRKYGTMPFGSYLRGHIYRKEYPNRAQTEGYPPGWDIVAFQCYWRSAKDGMHEHDVVPAMVKMLYEGLHRMVELDLIDTKTLVHVHDHSSDWKGWNIGMMELYPAGAVLDFLAAYLSGKLWWVDVIDAFSWRRGHIYLDEGMESWTKEKQELFQELRRQRVDPAAKQH